MTALLAPFALGTLVLGPDFLFPPPVPGGPSCTDPLECGSWFPDAADLLVPVLLFLLLSLAIAAPLAVHLSRRLRSPMVAGSLAALSSLLLCTLVPCGLLGLIGR